MTQKMNFSDFGKTAKSLSGNPLGIIALFIVLIYGIAALIFIASTNQLETMQKWPLIWFLVLFPLAVLLAFVWLVANHSSKLYGPSDFRNDESFMRLNDKVHTIERRQNAAQVDPRGDPDTAYEVLSKLLLESDSETARNLAKAFLKIERFDVSFQMFDQIIRHNKTPKTHADRALAYRAYSLIGLDRFEEAAEDLVKLRAGSSNELFDFWPRLALAYCHMMLGNIAEFNVELDMALSDQKAPTYLGTAAKLYPELAEPLTSRLSLIKTAPNVGA